MCHTTVDFSMDVLLFLVVLILQVLLSMSQPLDFSRPGCDERIDTLRKKTIKDIRAAQLKLRTYQTIFNAIEVEDIGIFDNNIIFAGTLPLNWMESQSFCRRFNAFLAVIENEKLNNEIKIN